MRNIDGKIIKAIIKLILSYYQNIFIVYQ